MRRWLWGLLWVPLALPASEQIDTQHSRAQIAVRMRWWQTLDCNLQHFEGALDTLPDGRQQVTVRLDVRSLEIEGSASFTRWAQSEEFFDIRRYPWVVFVSAPFAPNVLREGGVLDGEVFLRGKFGPVRFTVKPAQCPRPGFECAIEASGAVSRRAFGMTTRLFVVRDKVKIRFSVMLQEPTP